jgi:uncharacterized protein (DUF486 family)
LVIGQAFLEYSLQTIGYGLLARQHTHIVQFKKSQNILPLVIGQAFFEYSLQTIEYGLLARQHTHIIQFNILFF